MSQSEGPRIISKYVEGVSVQFDADGDPKYSIISSGIGATNASGWVVADAANGILQWRGFIDISGYRPDDMVIVPTMVDCQWGAAFSSATPPSNTGGNIFIQYALTTDKIDDIDFGTAMTGEPLAGFIGDNSEMEQVIYAATEVWGPASTGFAMVPMQKNVYGDGPAIVGPRIYVAMRISLTPAVNSTPALIDTTFIIPPMRFVIAGNAQEVPMFQLLHLMKRQIDLQQTPDVDA